MPTINLKKLSAIIKERNDNFAKLSRPQQRIAIAKDVIDSIKLKKLIPTNLTYVTSEKLSKEVCAKPQQQICNLLENVPSCNVCAKGTLFVSAVKQKGKIKAEDLTTVGYQEQRFSHFTEDRISNYLKNDDLFSKKQLDMIEDQFEQDSMNSDGKYKAWKPRIKTAEGRMMAIMKNIVENHGTFKPFAKKYKRVKKTTEKTIETTEEVQTSQLNHVFVSE